MGTVDCIIDKLETSVTTIMCLPITRGEAQKQVLLSLVEATFDLVQHGFDFDGAISFFVELGVVPSVPKKLRTALVLAMHKGGHPTAVVNTALELIKD